jgi:hypothetical protein
MTTNIQKVMWTTLPNGFAGSPPSQAAGLQFSIFVAPQLQSDPTITNPTLALFPDFVDWPSVLSKMKFAVQFSNGQKVTATPVLTGPTAPNSALWKALFPSTSFVRPYAFDDYSQQFVYSYPVQNILSFVQGQYGQVGAGVNGQSLPTISGPASTPGTLRAFLDGALTLQQGNLQTEIAKLRTANPALRYIPGGAPNVFQDFLQARWFFHTPPNTPRPPLAVPTLDFHQAISAVGEYPGILRMLGLVIDFKIPFSTTIPASGQPNVFFVPTWTPSRSVTNTNLTPPTVYALNTSTFAAQPQSTEMSGGMLNLSNPGNSYGLIQLDVEGAMFKAVSLGFTLQSQATKRSADTPTTSGLPTLRSAGISLVKTGRAAGLVQRFQRSLSLRTALGTSTPALLYAEDLVRGYAVDVQPVGTTPGPWYSLMQRIGTYKFPTAPPSLQTVTLHDEGNFSLAPTRKPGVGPEFYVHEGMWHWENWSLAAPRPGAALDENGQPVRVQNTIQTPFQVQTSFTAEPGTLPALRFGKSYRMRARTMDLAGNLVPSTSTNDAGAIPDAGHPFVYRRFEPVNAPEVVLHDALEGSSDTPLSPGEAVRRLVVRSDYQKTNADWAVYGNGIMGTNQFLVDTQRHLAPPRISQEMAEIHGLFDVPAPTAADPNAVRPNPNAYNQILQYNDFGQGGGRFQSDVYTIPQLQMPYFADLFSRGAYLTGLPGAGSNPVTQSFDGTWPSVLPFRLLLQGIPDGSTPVAPAWDATNRILTVQIAQGDVITVNLSSYLNQADLPVMAIYQWIQQYIQQRGIVNPFWNKVVSAAIQGLHWMMTPFRDITLVHAVQRPLQQPNFSSFFQAAMGNGLQRSPGDTFVTFSEDMPLSKKSTNKLDVYATWTEPIDDGVNPAGAVQVQGSAHAFQVPVNPPTGSSDITQHIDQKHHFGDTKHRNVTYNAVASSRFKEYFPDAIATSGTGITLEGTAVPKNVDSSARPDAPKVLYIVPAFEWSTANVAGGTQVQRSARRLRVYLDRPWYSSGEGELLAAVMLIGDCTPDEVLPPIKLHLSRRRRLRGLLSGPPPCDAVKLYVSQWGNDPIWYQDGGPTRMPRAIDFGLSPTLTGTALQIPELVNADLEIAAYPVNFDTDRKLWYADMELITGDNYYPFIRLALARYQPNSLPDEKLSKVVLADFVQLAPDRTASVTFPVDPMHAEIVVSGVAGQLAGQTLIMNATVERQMTDVGASTTSDDDFGWVPDNHFDPIPLHGSGTTGQVTWTASIDLSQTPAAPLRIVIREKERYQEDPHTATQGPRIFSDDSDGTVSRIVYAAIFNVN